jgi:hypothetical protein
LFTKPPTGEIRNPRVEINLMLKNFAAPTKTGKYNRADNQK